MKPLVREFRLRTDQVFGAVDAVVAARVRVVAEEVGDACGSSSTAVVERPGRLRGSRRGVSP
ncbi:hypothetical protein [Saccharothrix coeruleofusca]|uniref:hypothetical protein n=1 Tax=Saccharothrix coeruleofusca TaxID=33919 RepID=UPI001670855E|nr:hypothetical protein [Saccharothrix coeruleofusca]MBP2337467.1 hypothetical protein [Saccharothrix coeruleofusca]